MGNIQNVIYGQPLLVITTRCRSTASSARGKQAEEGGFAELQQR